MSTRFQRRHCDRYLKGWFCLSHSTSWQWNPKWQHGEIAELLCRGETSSGRIMAWRAEHSPEHVVLQRRSYVPENSYILVKSKKLKYDHF